MSLIHLVVQLCWTVHLCSYKKSDYNKEITSHNIRFMHEANDDDKIFR